jgi:hypothetical protein
MLSFAPYDRAVSVDDSGKESRNRQTEKGTKKGLTNTVSPSILYCDKKMQNY